MFEGICSWVFEELDYEMWEQLDECEMLCIMGEEGIGKFYVMVFIVRQFFLGQGDDDEDEEDVWNLDIVYFYVICNFDVKEGKD